MRVKLIARVSTDHQDADMRMNELRQWAKRNNHIIVAEYWIYESATISLSERKEFLNAMKEDKGEELIVINKLDRITRNFESIAWFEDFIKNHRAKLVTLDYTPELETALGRFMFRQLLLLACFETEQMKERQLAGIARAKAEGKFKGRQKGAKGILKNSKINNLGLSQGEITKKVYSDIPKNK